MAKLKPLLPSLREKKRYVVFEVSSKDVIRKQDITKAIDDTYTHCFGVFGSAEAGILFLDNKFNDEKKRGILKINNKCVDRLKASFTLICEIAGTKATIRSVGVSGVLKKAYHNYLK